MSFIIAALYFNSLAALHAAKASTFEGKIWHFVGGHYDRRESDFGQIQFVAFASSLLYT